MIDREGIWVRVAYRHYELWRWNDVVWWTAKIIALSILLFFYVAALAMLGASIFERYSHGL